MQRALLVLALLLMTAAATSPLWVGWAQRGTAQRYQRVLVSGRVVGDLPDKPWEGTVVTLDTDTKPLGADGKFSFAALPGMHVIRVCCSTRFQSIYREVSVGNSDVYVELQAEPLWEIAGQILTPEGKPPPRAPKISMWLIGTNQVNRGVVYMDGTFSAHLPKGEWRIDLGSLEKDYTVESVTLDGRELRDRTFTITSVTGPSLPMRITLK
jgi:hypothetical protein